MPRESSRIFERRRGRRVGLRVVPVVVLLWGFSTVSAGTGDWVEFTNETGARLTASAAVGVADVEEKDFAWGDVDQDGDIDLVCVRKEPFSTTGRRVNVLFLNENGVLVDRTRDFVTASDVPGDAGFQTPTNDRDVLLVDVDGDTFVDLVTAVTLSDGQPKHISHPRIYRNLGHDPQGAWLGFLYEDARFPDGPCCEGSFPHAPRFCSAAAGDFDGDGSLDLAFGDYDNATGAPTEADGADYDNRIYMNDGNGFFVDETATALPDFDMRQSAFGAATELHDMNGDGTLDIVKQTSLNPPQHVAITYNDPANEGTFFAYEVIYQQAPYFVEVGDLNNDTQLDLVITDDFEDRIAIHIGNDANGFATFEFYSFSPSPVEAEFGGNSVMADFDNDGFLDVLITDVDVDLPGCTRRSHLYHNLGDTPLVTLVDSGTAPWIPTGVHDAAVFDLNGDGDLDIVYGRCSGIEVWIQTPRPDLLFSYPRGRPRIALTNGSTTFEVAVSAADATPPVPGSLDFFVSVAGGPYESIPTLPLGDDRYELTLPPAPCTSRLEFYVTARSQAGVTNADPRDAPRTTFGAVASDGTPTLVLADAIEGSVASWTAISEPGLAAGAWEAAEPEGTSNAGLPLAPSEDATPGVNNVRCFVTENGLPGGAPGAADVDGGFARLVTPPLDFTGADGLIHWSEWFVSDDVGTPQGDSLTIEISNDGGTNWMPIDTVTDTGHAWRSRSILVSDHVVPSGDVRMRFTTSDIPNDSFTEAAIDDLLVEVVSCGGTPVEFRRGDVNTDGTIDVSDPIDLVNHLFAAGEAPDCLDAADGNDDGALGLADALDLLSALFGNPTTPLPPPYPGCGEDPPGTSLGCDRYAGCP